MRSVSVIEYVEAQKIVGFIVNRASEMNKAVAVAVTDSHGELIAFARMDGVPLPSVSIAMNKAWTAARTGKPTEEIGEKVKDPNKGHDISYYGDPRFVGWGGGIPLWKGDEVVGAVAVSGLSSKEDVALASWGTDLIKMA
jgi:glc operon protein GlcG